jgi:hypothetical protein
MPSVQSYKKVNGCNKVQITQTVISENRDITEIFRGRNKPVKDENENEK